MKSKISLAFLLLFAVAISFHSCKKVVLEDDDPVCLKDKIREFDRNEDCASASVDAYSFQSQTVYVFNPGTCGADMQSDVLDGDCDLLGRLGGITGNNTINGESFANAEYIRNVWRK